MFDAQGGRRRFSAFRSAAEEVRMAAKRNGSRRPFEIRASAEGRITKRFSET
jgi:hypothetical protein